MDELDAARDGKAFSRIGFALFLMIAVTFVLQYGAFLLFGRMETQTGELTWQWYAVLLLSQYVVAMPAAWLVLRPLPKTQTGNQRLDARRFLVIIPICVFLMYAGSLAGNIVFSMIESISHKEIPNILEGILSKSDVWASLAVFGVAAPVFEELFFRKLLIGRLNVYGEKIAVFVSALIFSLIHGNFTQVFYAFGLGMAFGYIYVKTGRIIYTIVIHVAINILGGVVTPIALEDRGILASAYFIFMFGMVIAGLVLFVKNKSNIRYSGAEKEPRDWKRKAFLNAGMISFFAACAVMFALDTCSAF